MSPPTPEGPALRLFGLCSRTQPREVLRPGLDRLKLGKIFYELPFVLLSLGQQRGEDLIPVDRIVELQPLLIVEALPQAGPVFHHDRTPRTIAVRIVFVMRVAEAEAIRQDELDALHVARDDVRALEDAGAFQMILLVELAAEAVPAADAE